MKIFLAVFLSLISLLVSAQDVPEDVIEDSIAAICLEVCSKGDMSDCQKCQADAKQNYFTGNQLDEAGENLKTLQIQVNQEEQAYLCQETCKGVTAPNCLKDCAEEDELKCKSCTETDQADPGVISEEKVSLATPDVQEKKMSHQVFLSAKYLVPVGYNCEAKGNCHSFPLITVVGKHSFNNGFYLSSQAGLGRSLVPNKIVTPPSNGLYFPHGAPGEGYAGGGWVGGANQGGGVTVGGANQGGGTASSRHYSVTRLDFSSGLGYQMKNGLSVEADGGAALLFEKHRSTKATIGLRPIAYFNLGYTFCNKNNKPMVSIVGEGRFEFSNSGGASYLGGAVKFPLRRNKKTSNQ